MARIIKFFAWALVIMMAMFVLLLITTRMRPPSELQQEALDTLKAEMPPVRGRDGSAAVWLLEYDVPEAEQAEVAEKLRRYYNDVDALKLAGREDQAKALVDPLAGFPKFPTVNTEVLGLCAHEQQSCLATVRVDPAATAATLARHRAGLNAALRVANFDGFRYGLVASMTQPTPPYSSQRLLVRTHYAAQFSNGLQDASLAGLCADIGAWRRLGGNNDNLIGSMVGASYVRQDLMLLAEMLAEMPAELSWPPACSAALKPSEAYEFDLCPAVRNEFRSLETMLFRQLVGEADNPAQRFAMELALDKDHVLAVSAPAYSQYCSKRVRQAALDDSPTESVVSAASTCNLYDHLADPFGCYLAELAVDVNFSKYANRRTDLAASLALMRTVVWLRGQSADTGTWSSRLQARPASLGLHREPSISSDGKSISIPLLDQSRGANFGLLIRP